VGVISPVAAAAARAVSAASTGSDSHTGATTGFAAVTVDGQTVRYTCA
jgi:hypothetical protein